MKNTLRISILLFFSFITILSAQDFFEGELKYKIDYESLNPNIPESYLERELGSSFSAYVKEDRYTMIYDAKGTQGWMKVIVRLDQGYTYTEYEKLDTIVKTKFGSEKNKLVHFKRNSANKKEILDELCESVSIHYEPQDPTSYFQSFQGTYYFNPKYKLNSKLYDNYTDGFWNLFVGESNAISIRNEISFSPLFKSIQEVTSIEPKQIPLEMFEPNTAKIIAE